MSEAKNEPQAQLEAVPSTVGLGGMQYEHHPCGIVKVKAPNGVFAGAILKGDDGYFEFWPEHRGGYWPAWSLRDIADKVDALNAEWDAIVQKELAP